MCEIESQLTTRVGQFHAGPALIFALDQVVNTGSNFIALSIIAHVLRPVEFGIFSTAQVATLVLQVAAQAGSSDELLAVPVDQPAERELIATGVRDRYALLPLVGLIAFAAASFTPQSRVGFAMFLVAYVVCLAFTDFVRNYLYAYRRLAMALLLDLSLALAEISSLVYWRRTREPHASIAWEALSAPYLLLALAGLVVTLHLLGSVFRIPTKARFRWRYAGEMGGTLGISQLAQLAFVAVAGVAFAGQYRAVLLLLGPALLVINSSRPLLILLYSRRSDLELHLLVSAGLAAVCLFWGLICIVLPIGIRIAVLGKQADVPHSLLLSGVVLAVSQAIFSASYYRARALGNDKWTTRGKFLQAILVVIVTALAVVTLNADLLVLGFAAGALLPVVALTQSISTTNADGRYRPSWTRPRRPQ